MAGLAPPIHVLAPRRKTWMPGTRPGMTEERAAPGLHNRKLGVLAVGDQHAAGIMRDAEFRLHRRDHRLRRHPAGPEHRQFVLAHFDAVAVIGLVDVLDADELRLANMNRRA